MSLFESASLVVTPNGTKASKLYAIKPTSGAGDLTVTRATTATRVNSAGLIESVAVNVPRLDYTDSTCPSILVEPQRTNLQTYSEDFTNLVWAANLNASASANLSISPDGTMSADKIIENTSNSQHFIGQTQAGLISTSYTISVFAKAAERSFIFLFEDSAGGRNAYFDLTNGVVGNVGASATAKIENFGNGWYKCSVTYVSSGLLIRYRIGTALSNGVNSYLGNGTSGLFIWGAQIEAGGYVTSYIPTVASAVTRNADVISKTGISSLIGQTEGTIFFDGKINALPVDGSLFGIQKNASNFVIRFGSQGTNIYAQSYNGSANLFFEATPYTLGSRVKAAFAYKAGSYAFYINGVQIATGSNATAIPACDATMFNSLWGSFNDSLSFYSAAALWKTRLTNAELAEITTI